MSLLHTKRFAGADIILVSIANAIGGSGHYWLGLMVLNVGIMLTFVVRAFRAKTEEAGE